MYLKSLFKIFLGVLLISASMTVAISYAADTYISCKSDNRGYRSCSLPRSGDVYIKYEVSRNKCRRGKNWGYTNSHIWVKNGCSAKFGVNYYLNNKKDDYYPVYPQNPPRYVTKQPPINKNVARVPRWMVGTHKGVDKRKNIWVRMTIRQDGTISVRDARGRHSTGTVKNRGVLIINSRINNIRRTRNGFVVKRPGDYRNPIRFHRVPK